MGAVYEGKFYIYYSYLNITSANNSIQPIRNCCLSHCFNYEIQLHVKQIYIFLHMYVYIYFIIKEIVFGNLYGRIIRKLFGKKKSVKKKNIYTFVHNNIATFNIMHVCYSSASSNRRNTS